MKRSAKALFAAVLAALSSILPAAAQQPGFPQTMPPSTVYGRSAISAGPGQAIPFSLLIQNLASTPNVFKFPQAFTGGAIGPYTGALAGASGNFLSASGPAISVQSVGISPGSAPTYAEQLIQWTTVQDSTIAEAGLWINGTYSTGYNTTPGVVTNFKCGLCIAGETSGAGAGKIWNSSSAMIINSGWLATNNFAAVAEWDITNFAFDASPGVGNIYDQFIGGSIGSFPITAFIAVSPGANGGVFGAHIGLFFSGATSIQDQTINDSTHSTTSYQDNGTHTNGYNLAGTYSAGAINFASGTFSGNQITGKGWDVTSGGRGDFAGLTASTGAFSPFAICAWNTNYDGLSFNNNCGLTAILGIAGGASGDNNIYSLVPTGGGFVWRVNGASVMDYGATTASTWTLAAAVATPNLPTSAGGGGIFVCVDTAGKLYKKSTCP